MARKPEPEKAPNHERWLVSYADFITLLFAFFVVMFASSNTDVEKQAEMEKSMQKAFGGLGFSPFISARPVPGISSGAAPGAGSPDIVIGVQSSPNSLLNALPNDDATSGDDEGPDNMGQAPDFNPLPKVPDEFGQGATSEPDPTPTPAGQGNQGAGAEGSPELRKMYSELESALQQELKLGKIEMRQERRGVVISLSEAGFFDSGSAVLKASSLKTIDQIARKLLAVGRNNVAIRIEGHTDDVRLSPGSKFRSNLELSTARANSVIHRLIRAHSFPPRALIASGYGEWRPIADNSTPEGRARNRRVDIVILNDEFAGLEARN